MCLWNSWQSPMKHHSSAQHILNTAEIAYHFFDVQYFMDRCLKFRHKSEVVIILYKVYKDRQKNYKYSFCLMVEASDHVYV